MMQERLFRAGYKCVLYTDVDEFIVPDPNKYPGGLDSYLQEFVKDPKRIHHRVRKLNFVFETILISKLMLWKWRLDV